MSLKYLLCFLLIVVFSGQASAMKKYKYRFRRSHGALTPAEALYRAKQNAHATVNGENPNWGPLCTTTSRRKHNLWTMKNERRKSNKQRLESQKRSKEEQTKKTPTAETNNFLRGLPEL